MESSQTHFTKHDKGKAKQSGTMREAGYYSGHSTTCTIMTELTTQSDASALTRVITYQTTENAAQFPEMMDLLKLQAENDVSGTRNTREINGGEKKKYNC